MANPVRILALPPSIRSRRKNTRPTRRRVKKSKPQISFEKMCEYTQKLVATPFLSGEISVTTSWLVFDRNMNESILANTIETL